MARKRIHLPGKKPTLASVAQAKLPQLTVARADVEGQEHVLDLAEHMKRKADPVAQLEDRLGRAARPAEATIAAQLGRAPNRSERRARIQRRQVIQRSAFKGIR